jgi:sarcosine oxidase, subunit beta
VSPPVASVPPFRVVIVGAGIMGVSIAYFLAERGVHATVVERGEVAGGATGLSAGAYRSQFPWPEETAIALRSKELRARLERDTRVDLGFREVGFVLAASDAESEAELRRRRPFQDALGVRAELLDAARLCELLPGLFCDDIRYAVYTPDDGWAPPVNVTRAIMAIAEANGARLVPGIVADVRVSGDAVSGVTLSDGRVLDADVVIDAAGLGAREIALRVGLDLPITSNRQHQFFSGSVTGFEPETIPNFTDPALGLYMRGEGDAVLLSVADPAEAGRLDTEITESLRARALRCAQNRWPAVAERGVPRGYVGCYEATPDRRALVGAHPGLAGFCYVGGFSGHGFMHGLAIGECMAGYLLDARWPTVDLGGLAADRFSGGAEAAWAGGAQVSMGGEHA